MTDRWTERLSEYLDGDLAPREQAECARHLETCAECRAIVEDLRAVVTRAGTAGDLMPAVDLWPAIARRLDAPEARRDWSRLLRFRIQLSVPQLAAAALALVLVSGGGVWLALERPWQTTRPLAQGGAPSGTTLPTPTTSAAQFPAGAALAPAGTLGVAPAGFDASRYDAAVAELEQVLRDHRRDLDTTTVRVIEQNLATIDRAISDARRALAADPANPYLNGHLTEQLQAKVRLLQRATEAIAANSG